MNATHQNDVIFTRNSLNKFIKLIKTEGIKNLDYYLLPDGADVKNVLGYNEFSPTEKKLYNNHIAIVNKSYAWEDPFVSLNDTEQGVKVLTNNLSTTGNNVYNIPSDMQFTVSVTDSNYTISTTSITYETILDKKDKKFYYRLKPEIEETLDLITNNLIIDNSNNFSTSAISIEPTLSNTPVNYNDDNHIGKIINFDINYSENLDNFSLDKTYYISDMIETKHSSYSDGAIIIQYPSSSEIDSNDDFKQAILNNNIYELQENINTFPFLSNFYQIHFDSTSKHLLQDAAIKIGYDSNSATVTNKYSLLYNKTIPIKSLDIRSWEKLDKKKDKTLFPNITTTTGIYNWQPSDLINLYSNYQMMKSIDGKITSGVYATTANAHQIVFEENPKLYFETIRPTTDSQNQSKISKYKFTVLSGISTTTTTGNDQRIIINSTNIPQELLNDNYTNILIIPMLGIATNPNTALYSSTALSTTSYGLFAQTSSIANYELIGYYPQADFYETELLSSIATADQGKKLLEDRFNNSINNYIESLGLDQDTDIFDIVLRTNTSTTAPIVPIGANGFYDKDLGFYQKINFSSTASGAFKLTYTPHINELYEGDTGAIESIFYTCIQDNNVEFDQSYSYQEEIENGDSTTTTTVNYTPLVHYNTLSITAANSNILDTWSTTGKYGTWSSTATSYDLYRYINKDITNNITYTPINYPDFTIDYVIDMDDMAQAATASMTATIQSIFGNSNDAIYERQSSSVVIDNLQYIIQNTATLEEVLGTSNGTVINYLDMQNPQYQYQETTDTSPQEDKIYYIKSATETYFEKTDILDNFNPDTSYYEQKLYNNNNNNNLIIFYKSDDPTATINNIPLNELQYAEDLNDIVFSDDDFTQDYGYYFNAYILSYTYELTQTNLNDIFNLSSNENYTEISFTDDISYQANKYYYFDNNVYILDSSNTKTDNRQYYYIDSISYNLSLKENTRNKQYYIKTENKLALYEKVTEFAPLDSQTEYFQIEVTGATTGYNLTNVFQDRLGIKQFYQLEQQTKYGVTGDGTFSVKVEYNKDMYPPCCDMQWVYNDMYNITSMNYSVESASSSTHTNTTRLKSILQPFVEYRSKNEMKIISTTGQYILHLKWPLQLSATAPLKITGGNRIVYLEDFTQPEGSTLDIVATNKSATVNFYSPVKLLNRSNMVKNSNYVVNPTFFNNNFDYMENDTYSQVKKEQFFDCETLRQNSITRTAKASTIRWISYSTTAALGINDAAPYFTSFSTSAGSNVTNYKNHLAGIASFTNFFEQTDSTTRGTLYSTATTAGCILVQNKTNLEAYMKRLLIQLNNKGKYWLFLGATRSAANKKAGSIFMLCPYPIDGKFTIWQFIYDNNGSLVNVLINSRRVFTKNGDTYTYNTSNYGGDKAGIFSTDLAKSEAFRDIYHRYFELRTDANANPYPAGPPIYFKDWCTTNLSTTAITNETQMKNHYYYSIKLPDTLTIEDNETYYGYTYDMDIINNESNSYYTTTDANKNGKYIVAHSIVKKHLPDLEDKNQKLFIKDSYSGEELAELLHTLITKDISSSSDSEYQNYANIYNSLDYHYICDPSDNFNIESLEDINDNNIFSTTASYIAFKAGKDAKYQQLGLIPLSNSATYYYKQEYKNHSSDASGLQVEYQVFATESQDQEYKPLYTLIEPSNPFSYTANTYYYPSKENESIYLLDTKESSATERQYRGKQPVTINTTKAYPTNTIKQIDINFTSTAGNIEDHSRNLNFRHTFIKIPDHQYTNSYTKDNPFPDINLTIDKEGKLIDPNEVLQEGQDYTDQSPNGTFSIDSGDETPGTLVQIRGFNDAGEYTGDLNGSTLNNVNVGDGILAIHDESDAWRKPIIDVMKSAVNIAPEDEGGNIYASIVTAGGISAAKKIKGERLYGAIWNDYAEYRQTADIEPGRCVIETGNGDLVLSTKRLQGGANITSDTFGMGVGESSIAKTPIAVSGRVLAYPYEEKRTYEAGDAVCSGPDGTVSKMTREEIREWPDRIVGYVSEIPNYTIWGTGKVPVNGRIWIKVH